MHSSVEPRSLVLLDRDGVVVVNRGTNIKQPHEIELIEGAAGAIARLNAAGCEVAICTNQPEVARRAMTRAQLDEVHEGLRALLAREGATVSLIVCCTDTCKSPRRKPACGMLTEALHRYGARAAETRSSVIR
jgi:D-glycero-D-manno-heptose 1,7-bisphosphate phosphatase